MARTRFQVGSRGLRSRFLGVWFPVVMVLCALVGAIRLVEVKVQPVVLATAQAIAARAATDALNHALTEEVVISTAGKPLIEVERDTAGHVSVAQFDFASIAHLQSEATLQANAQLQQMTHETFHLPIGEVVGGSLFGSVGPDLPIRFTLIGHVQSMVSTRSETVGINQSIHEVDLEVTAQVRVLTPLAAAPTTVHAQMPVAYIVFGGEVPNTFLYNAPQRPAGQGS